MRSADIKLPLTKLRPYEVYLLLGKVADMMAGNPLFATPAIPYPAMLALAGQLDLAIKAAINGGLQERVARNELVDQGKVLLSAQADYVRSVCRGNAMKLASSGYSMRKTPEPVGMPGQPGNMQARSTGIVGQVELRWNSLYGSQGFQVWMTDQDPAIAANWQSRGYTHRITFLVSDLESFKPYWFCVSAIGAAGEGALSDPAIARAA